MQDKTRVYVVKIQMIAILFARNIDYLLTFKDNLAICTVN